MDKILIRGLKVSACHGVKDFEKTNPQPFVFDADIFYDFRKAYLSDALDDTINYSAASKLIVATATENSFDLIEKLAYECAYAVMENLPARKISLTVFKPEAPMKQVFDSVGVTVEAERTTAYLSLGSSLGDRKGYLDSALGKISNTRFVTLKKVSDYFDTRPLGGVAQNNFLNCAAEIETLLSPHELLRALHAVEAECGRVRGKRWDDRTLDVDIIFFGDKIIASDGLIVPHPDYAQRDFVLKPLSQIAPDFVCPVLRRRIADIALG